MATESSSFAPGVTPPSGQRRRRWLPTFLALLIPCVLVIAFLSAFALLPSRRAWEDALKDQTTRSLTDKARMFSSRVAADRSRSIQEITLEEAKLASARATVIDTNGKVIADSEVPLAALEDEGKRPEFATALRGSTGVETRSRSSFGVPVIFVAVPVSGGAVRLASPFSDLDVTTSQVDKLLIWGILGSSFLALFISALIAWLLTRN